MRFVRRQPWILSATFDSIWILGPAFFATALVIVFCDSFAESSDVPLWAWVLFILAIDVTHVYSTLYRTYFISEEFRKHRTLYTVIPLLCWLTGCLLYSLDPLYFWRVLAYLAVFHFIRQQYGFLRIYGAKGGDDTAKFLWIDQVAIYAATLYPLIYWHTNLPRQFHWFVEGDFVSLPLPMIELIARAISILILILYIGKEIFVSVQRKAFNLPKNLLVLGTALSWYVGIVLYNGDMAFTVTNVVAHGIPYMALVWVYGRGRFQKDDQSRLFSVLSFQQLHRIALVPVFFAVIFIIAYLEEGLWDGLVWKEHASFFPLFTYLPKLQDHATLSWIVPLLALPQATHYALDGFIWKLKGQNSSWKSFTIFR